MNEKTVFVTGATGYMGRALIPRLLARGHRVLALARRGSESRLPAGVETVTGDALDAATYRARVPRGATFVHLVGVAHPSPTKAAEFRDVDLASLKAALAAAKRAGVAHFVYLSVAQPRPMMKAYGGARRGRASPDARAGIPRRFSGRGTSSAPVIAGRTSSCPSMRFSELLPATRDGARRLGLVTLAQMTVALVAAVETPPSGVRIVTVPEIRAAAAT